MCLGMQAMGGHRVSYSIYHEHTAGPRPAPCSAAVGSITECPDLCSMPQENGVKEEYALAEAGRQQARDAG